MISRNDNGLQVSGRLTMETVAALFNADFQPDTHGTVAIDLAQVEASDSAAVSLLLCWLRRAQHDGITLRFSHIPDDLLSLARLYGVAELLPVNRDISA
jgi:phospholipid transport system transporter-binding protein